MLWAATALCLTSGVGLGGTRRAWEEGPLALGVSFHLLTYSLLPACLPTHHRRLRRRGCHYSNTLSLLLAACAVGVLPLPRARTFVALYRDRVPCRTHYWRACLPPHGPCAFRDSDVDERPRTLRAHALHLCSLPRLFKRFGLHTHTLPAYTRAHTHRAKRGGLCHVARISWFGLRSASAWFAARRFSAWDLQRVPVMRTAYAVPLTFLSSSLSTFLHPGATPLPLPPSPAFGLAAGRR